MRRQLDARERVGRYCVDSQKKGVLKPGEAVLPRYEEKRIIVC